MNDDWGKERTVGPDECAYCTRGSSRRDLCHGCGKFFCGWHSTFHDGRSWCLQCAPKSMTLWEGRLEHDDMTVRVVKETGNGARVDLMLQNQDGTWTRAALGEWRHGIRMRAYEQALLALTGKRGELAEGQGDRDPVLPSR